MFNPFRRPAAEAAAPQCMTDAQVNKLCAAIAYERAIAATYHSGNTEAHMAAWLQHQMGCLVGQVHGGAAKRAVDLAFRRTLSETEMAAASAHYAQQQQKRMNAAAGKARPR